MSQKSKTEYLEKMRYRYDDPKTPADRMLEWQGISREKAAWIRKQKRHLNPFELQRRVESSLRKVFEFAWREENEE